MPVLADKDYISLLLNCQPILGRLNDAASSVEDGSFLTLSIDKVSITPDCPATGKGTIQVTSTSATGNITYTLNGTTNTTGIFTGLDPGSYNISVSTGTETMQYANNPVVVTAFTVDKPLTIVSKTNPLCLQSGSITLNTAANSTSYTIKYNNSSYGFGHVFAGLTAGTHHFDILNTTGCIVDNMDVELVQTPCEVITFPNTFSPNNDGINDIFGPSQTGVADNLKLRIYNRLGVLIFTSTSAANGWDGRYKGKNVPWGVYYYTASYINNESKAISKSGYITLIR